MCQISAKIGDLRLSKLACVCKSPSLFSTETNISIYA